MRLPPRFTFSTLLALVLVTGISAGRLLSGDDPETAPGEARASMALITDALTTAFVLSLDDETFQAVENRESILQALEVLASEATQLDAHGGGLDASTGYLRSSLARDADGARDAYRDERFESARLRLHQLTENCFACHTRLPQGESSALGRRLADTVKLDRLEPSEQVRFLVATRQFEQALAVSEQALRSPGVPPARIAGLFEDFLKLSVRVHQSFGKARVALETFQQRPAVPRYLGVRVENWIDALEQLQTGGPLRLDMPTARRLLDEGRRRNQFPSDRRGLVHFVAASGLLFSYIDRHRAVTDELAEAYYLLGIAESHISASAWTEQTEFFLETAIRTRPASAVAREAFEFLREFVIAKYSGSAGVFVPEPVWRSLDELRVLIDGPGTPG